MGVDHEVPVNKAMGEGQKRQKSGAGGEEMNKICGVSFLSVMSEFPTHALKFIFINKQFRCIVVPFGIQ